MAPPGLPTAVTQANSLALSASRHVGIGQAPSTNRISLFRATQPPRLLDGLAFRDHHQHIAGLQDGVAVGYQHTPSATQAGDHGIARSARPGRCKKTALMTAYGSLSADAKPLDSLRPQSAVGRNVRLLRLPSSP